MSLSSCHQCREGDWRRASTIPSNPQSESHPRLARAGASKSPINAAMTPPRYSDCQSSHRRLSEVWSPVFRTSSDGGAHENMKPLKIFKTLANVAAPPAEGRDSAPQTYPRLISLAPPDRCDPLPNAISAMPQSAALYTFRCVCPVDRRTNFSSAATHCMISR
jgi:hypothetical protein